MSKLLGRGKLRGHLLGRCLVRLGYHEELEIGLGAVDMASHPGVAGTDGLGRVDEKCDHIRVRELGKGRLVELLAKAVLWLVEARRVDDHELRVGGVHNRTQTLAGGLRHGTRDGDLLAHTGVDQRRLAHVWPSHEGHEATSEGCVVIVVFHVHSSVRQRDCPFVSF